MSFLDFLCVYELVNGKCVDIDECSQPTSCQGCANTEGSYTCSCTVGYEWKDGQCVDIDECLRFNDPFGRCTVRWSRMSFDTNFQRILERNILTYCTNSIGGYQVTCDDGYRVCPDFCKFSKFAEI